MTVPTGNGEARGPESAGDMGTKLPGTRPQRAAANNARNRDFLGATPVADQAGFGEEDFQRDANFLNRSTDFPSDHHNKPPDLSVLGDPGQTFGGS